MIKKEELLKILQSSVDESLRGFPSVVFIDTVDQLLVHEIFSAVSDYTDKRFPRTTVITEIISSQNTPLPYYPFLKIITERLAGKNREEVEQILEEAAVYRCHRELFINHFCSTSSLRVQELIFEEYDFEKSCFRNDILSLLLAVSGGSLVLQISRLENMTHSAAEFIWYLQNFCGSCKIQFIFAMNVSGILENENSPDYLKSFASDIFSAYSVFDINTTKSMRERYPFEISMPTEIKSSEFVELFNFLCIEESAGHAVCVYNKLANHLASPDMDTVLLSLHVATVSYYYQSEFDISLFYANIYINQTRNLADPLWQSRAYRIASMLYYNKGDIDNSSRLAYQSLQHAETSGILVERALAHFALFLGKDTTSTAFLHPGEYEKLYDNMIFLFEKTNFHNYLSYVYSRSIYLMFLLRNKGEVLAHGVCSKGIEVSSQLGNNFRLAVAYQAQGLLLQTLRQNDNAIISYNMAEAIKVQIGSPLEKARVYNGIGYFHFFNEHYPEAIDYYYKALALLEKTKQYEEICTTLVNLAFTYLFSFKYDECIHFLEETLRITNYLKINDLPFHPRFFVYCILGIAYIKKKRLSKALELINRIQTHQRVSLITRHEYYKFFLAEIERFNGNTDGASILYEDMIINAREIEAETKHIMLFAYFEYGMMFRETGNDDRAREVFVRALDEIGDNNCYDVHKRLISSALDGRTPDPLAELQFRPFDSSMILHFVKLDATMNNLHKKIMEINFLNSLQSILVSSPDTTDIISKTGALVDASFIGTFCLICVTKDRNVINSSPVIDRFDVAHCSSELDESQRIFLFQKILSQLGKDERLILSYPQDFENTPLGSIYSAIYVPIILDQDNLAGFLLVLSGKKEIVITPDDLRTLSIAARQVTTAIELKTATANLLKAATIDSLTGVYNRQELHRKIETERQRVYRYNNDQKNRFSVLFIDLDNFKFYNDTYGHHTGDIVLKYFIKILEASVRNVDVVGRLGGDEFIIMLPETTKEASVIIAQRILTRIKDKNAIIQVVKEAIGIEMVIPESKMLGCSIGVAEYNPAQNLTVDELLHRADKALYDAKRIGKNCYVISK